MYGMQQRKSAGAQWGRAVCCAVLCLDGGAETERGLFRSRQECKYRCSIRFPIDPAVLSDREDCLDVIATRSDGDHAFSFPFVSESHLFVLTCLPYCFRPGLQLHAAQAT